MPPVLSLVHRVRPSRSNPLGAGSSAPLLLLLHGIGSNEDDLFSLAPYLDERFLIVSARAPLVIGPGAYAWFNIEFTARGLIADIAQAEQSRRLLVQFIEQLIEAYRADARSVYLMGFSQGAMMSLGVALTRPDKVAGVVAMSGRLPSEVITEMPGREALRGMPILITHGIYDPLLPVEQGRAAREILEKLPVTLTYREYEMGHEVSLESLRDTSAWLSSTLTAQTKAQASDDTPMP